MVGPERVGITAADVARFLEEFEVDDVTRAAIEGGNGVDIEIAPGVRVGLPPTKEGAPVIKTTGS